MSAVWSEPASVKDCAAAAGVELRGDEGLPFHCGDKMLVKGGIFGVDFAECETCGVLMVRIDSPHTNGGYTFSAEQYEVMGDEVWVWRARDETLLQATARPSAVADQTDGPGAVVGQEQP